MVHTETHAAEPTLFDTNRFAIGGTIARLAPDGRSAIAKLDHPIEGAELVVIGDGTVGRIDLMNKELFKEGTRVKFLELRRGPDAFHAVSVEPET